MTCRIVAPQTGRAARTARTRMPAFFSRLRPGPRRPAAPRRPRPASSAGPRRGRRRARAACPWAERRHPGGGEDPSGRRCRSPRCGLVAHALTPARPRQRDGEGLPVKPGQRRAELRDPRTGGRARARSRGPSASASVRSIPSPSAGRSEPRSVAGRAAEPRSPVRRAGPIPGPAACRPARGPARYRSTPRGRGRPGAGRAARVRSNRSRCLPWRATSAILRPATAPRRIDGPQRREGADARSRALRPPRRERKSPVSAATSGSPARRPVSAAPPTPVTVFAESSFRAGKRRS